MRIFQSRRSATVEKKKKRETSYAIPLQQRKSIRSRYPFVVLRRGGRQGATAAAANVTEGNFANSPKSRRRPLFFACADPLLLLLVARTLLLLLLLLRHTRHIPKQLFCPPRRLSPFRCTMRFQQQRNKEKSLFIHSFIHSFNRLLLSMSMSIHVATFSSSALENATRRPPPSSQQRIRKGKTVIDLFFFLSFLFNVTSNSNSNSKQFLLPKQQRRRRKKVGRKERRKKKNFYNFTHRRKEKEKDRKTLSVDASCFCF